MTNNQRANLHARIAADIALEVKAQCGNLVRYEADIAAARGLQNVSDECARAIRDTLLRHYTIRERRRS